MFSEGYASFEVSGAVKLTEVPEGFVFEDVMNTGTDYIIENSLTIPDATAKGGGSIEIAIAPDVEITLDGTLSLQGSILEFKPTEDGWKGLNITGNGGFYKGDYQSASLKFINAGNAAYSGAEAAALIENGSSFNNDDVLMTFEGSLGYDIYLSDNCTEASTYPVTTDNTVPLSANVQIMGSGFPVFSTEGAIDYLELRGDMSSYITMPYNSEITLLHNVYIKGGIAVSNYFTLYSSKKILMEEGTAFIAGAGMQLTSAEIEGKDGASWQGIYLGTNTSNQDYSNIYGITVRNAGSSVISNGSVTTTQAAAVYCTGDLAWFKDNTIENSGGYGLYLPSLNGTPGNTSNYTENTFSGNANAAVYTQDKYAGLFSDSEFTTPDGVAAIEFFQSTDTSFGPNTWDGLGAGNFYKTEDNLMIESELTFGEGVHLKVADGKGVFINANFTIAGTASNPVTIEGLSTGTDSWSGILLEHPASANFSCDYGIIDNGGSNIMFGSTEKANLVVKGTGSISCTNTTFSNSNGWGVVILSGATSYDFQDATYNNTFTSNASGDFLNNAK